MAKPSRPWWRMATQEWWTTRKGKQYPLGVKDRDDEAGALAALAVLLAKLEALERKFEQQQPQATPPAPVRLVADLVEEFLAKRKSKISPGCWLQYHTTLRVHFNPVFGERGITSLTADEIEDWADRPGWSSSTRNNNLGAVMTFLRWAGHPLVIRRPPKESRGADAVISPEQFARVLQATDLGDYGSDFRYLLQLLWETGARPQEIATLTVEMVDWANRCARLREHKTRRHGHDRIIHFNAVAMGILEQQREKYGAGLLLRTTKGNAWRRVVIVKRMAAIAKRSRVPMSCYSLRHSWATRALSAGMPDTVVAAVLGHRGTTMLHRHYSHLSEQAQVLKDALERLGRREAG